MVWWDMVRERDYGSSCVITVTVMDMGYGISVMSIG